MFKRIRFTIIFSLSLISICRMNGQMTMPDNVTVGQTRLYYVDPEPGSTYTWRIDGVVQTGFTTNEFIHTWNDPDTCLLEVREYSAFGCMGPVRSGHVYVSQMSRMSLIIHNAFSPNGDLINDSWQIGNSEIYPEMEVTIYNRWGQSVWKSEKGYPAPWDGRSKGADLPVDSYHYVIDLHNGSKPLIGDITIVR